MLEIKTERFVRAETNNVIIEAWKRRVGARIIRIWYTRQSIFVLWQAQ